jgi:choline monooxygenase
MTHSFDIDPDIRRAQTPPARIYYDEGVYTAARERIFARSWQPVGDTDRMKAPGHVLPFTLLEGCLDEPLVLTRADDDHVRCLSNVCTHRGTVVVEGEGHERSLRCRYHGRRFDLDGRFRSMPGFEDASDFPSADDDLASLPLHRWGPLLFVSIDPMCDFDAWIRPVRERVDWLQPERFVPFPERSADYLISANWALYCVNYLEGFHVPDVHAASRGD